MEATSGTDKPTRRRGRPYITAAFLLVVGAACSAPFIDRAFKLGKCDDAIKATLKAPSTYKRADYSLYSEGYPVNYTISYDAQNSYGVPLRDSGRCTLHQDGTVDWLPMPTLRSGEP